jgi:hypothetical protein
MSLVKGGGRARIRLREEPAGKTARLRAGNAVEEERRQLRTPLTRVNIMAVRYMIAIPVNIPADTCTRRVAVYDITVSESTTYSSDPAASA